MLLQFNEDIANIVILYLVSSGFTFHLNVKLGFFFFNFNEINTSLVLETIHCHHSLFLSLMFSLQSVPLSALELGLETEAAVPVKQEPETVPTPALLNVRVRIIQIWHCYENNLGLQSENNLYYKIVYFTSSAFCCFPNILLSSTFMTEQPN